MLSFLRNHYGKLDQEGVSLRRPNETPFKSGSVEV